jgi:hypothetical protein
MQPKAKTSGDSKIRKTGHTKLSNGYHGTNPDATGKGEGSSVDLNR